MPFPSEDFNSLLAGSLKCDRRTSGYCPCYSRTAAVKHDSPGLGETVLCYNRGFSILTEKLLAPQVGDAMPEARTVAAPLEISAELSAPGWAAREGLTCPDADVLVYELQTQSEPPPVWHGEFPLAVAPGFGGAWRYDAASRVLEFSFVLPRTDKRDPMPEYPVQLVFALPRRLTQAWLADDAGERELPFERADAGVFVGKLRYRFAQSPGAAATLWALGFDMGERETSAALRQRVLAARDAGYAAARAACAVWLDAALGEFHPSGRNTAERRASAHAAWTLLSNTFVPQGKFAPCHPTYPAHTRYSAHYTWDTCFQNLAYSHWRPDLAADALRILVRNQEPDGKIPQFVCSAWNRPGESQPPLVAWSAWNLHRFRSNLGLLQELYAPLARNAEWWLRERDENRDGLLEYFAPLESGWDDSPRWDSGRVTALDLNSFFIMHLRCLAEIAYALGETSAARDWHARAQAHAQQLTEYCYFPKENRFWDRRLEDGAPVRVLTPACFLPLWAGAPLAEPRAREMIETCLLDKRHFFGAYPFPVVAYSDPTYQPGKWWRGPVWLNIAYLMLEVLDRYGYAAARDAAADRLIAMALKSGGTYELFDSATGEGQSVVEYGWTAAVLWRLLDFRERDDFRPAAEFA